MPQSGLLRHEGAHQHHLCTTLLICMYETERLVGPPLSNVACRPLAGKHALGVDGVGGALTSTWRQHVCPDAAHVQVHFSIQRLFCGINDLGDCITVAVF